MWGYKRLQLWHTGLVVAVARWLKPKRLRVYPLAITSLMLVAWSISQLLGAGLFDAAGKVIGTDFLAFYTGGSFFLDGRLDELYDFAAQHSFQQELLGDLAKDSLAAFVNPPFTVLLFAPFAVSGYLPGLLAWWAAGATAVALAASMFRQAVLPAGAPSVRRLVLYSFLFYPTVACFLFGQSTAFVLVIYVLAYVLLRRGKDFPAGLVLAQLLYKPHLALGFGLVLLVQRRWRALAGGTVGGLAWVAISLALGPDVNWVFLRLSSLLMELEREVGWAEFSLWFASILLLDGVWRAGADLLGAALTAGGMLLVVRWWWGEPWRPGTRRWDLTMAATLALGLLISPHLMVYELTLLLLPLAIVWRHFPSGTGERALDGGPLLAWSGLLYVAAFVTSYLTLAQLKLTAALGLPHMAVQMGVPIILGWALIVQRRAGDGARQLATEREVVSLGAPLTEGG